MNRLDGLRKIDKNVRGAMEVANLFIPHMTKREKQQWENLVGQHLRAAANNIAGLEKKAVEKGLEKL